MTRAFAAVVALRVEPFDGNKVELKGPPTRQLSDPKPQ